MKVLIVNTYDRGGAANACFRLHLALKNAEIESKVLVLEKTKTYPNSFQFQKNKKRLLTRVLNKGTEKLKRYGFFKKLLTNNDSKFINSRTKGLELFSFPNSKYDITKTDLYKQADIINLHWVANFLDFESFFKKNTKPVVWTLHDMNPFTGGEHYTELEFGISQEGKPLKRQFTELENTIFSRNLNLKLKTINTNNLTIVSPSKWLQEQAKLSVLFKNNKIFNIPNGLNADIFKSRDKTFSRELFDIPLNKKVVLFVADSIENNRKGFVYLKNALEKIDDPNMMLCSIGRGKPNIDTSVEIKHLGELRDEKMISVVYSLADVFVIPSLMDNLPNTVIEALLCGTPVIGFPVGGIPDMIQNGKNGLITNTISVAAFSQAINTFFKTGVQLSPEEIRQDALTKYDQNIQANNYIELFKKILKEP